MRVSNDTDRGAADNIAAIQTQRRAPCKPPQSCCGPAV